MTTKKCCKDNEKNTSLQCRNNGIACNTAATTTTASNNSLNDDKYEKYSCKMNDKTDSENTSCSRPSRLPAFVIFHKATDTSIAGITNNTICSDDNTADYPSLSLLMKTGSHNKKTSLSKEDLPHSKKKIVSFSQNHEHRCTYEKYSSSNDNESDDVSLSEYFDHDLLWYSDNELDQFETESQKECSSILWKLYYRKMLLNNSAITTLSYDSFQNGQQQSSLIDGADIEQQQQEQQQQQQQEQNQKRQHDTCTNLENTNTNELQLAFNSKNRGLEYYYCIERQRRKQCSIQYIVRAYKVLISSPAFLIQKPCGDDGSIVKNKLAQLAQRCTNYATELAIEEASRDNIRAYYYTSSSLSSSNNNDYYFDNNNVSKSKFTQKNGNNIIKSNSFQFMDQSFFRYPCANVVMDCKKYNDPQDSINCLPNQYHQLINDDDDEDDDDENWDMDPISSCESLGAVVINQPPSAIISKDNDDDNNSIMINKKCIYIQLKEYKIQNGFNDDIWDHHQQQQQQQKEKRTRVI